MWLEEREDTRSSTEMLIVGMDMVGCDLKLYDPGLAHGSQAGSQTREFWQKRR